MTIQVRDEPERSRYTISVDGELAGLAAYRDSDGARVLTHTEIDLAFEGRGLGTTLVKETLDDVRARSGRIVALCPFVRSYVESNPEVSDLIDHDLDRQLRR